MVQTYNIMGKKFSFIAAVKKYFTRDRGYRKGGLVSPQTLYENGIASMFRRG